MILSSELMVPGNTIKTALVSIWKRSQQSLMDGLCVFAISRTTISPIWETTQDRLIDGIRDIPALPTPHKWTI